MFAGLHREMLNTKQLQKQSRWASVTLAPVRVLCFFVDGNMRFELNASASKTEW